MTHPCSLCLRSDRLQWKTLQSGERRQKEAGEGICSSTRHHHYCIVWYLPLERVRLSFKMKELKNERNEIDTQKREKKDIGNVLAPYP